MEYSDIINLIALCHDAGVEALEFQDLKLKFRGQPGETFHVAKPMQQAVVPDNVEARNEEAERLAARIEEQALEELRLSDPYEFEQRMTKVQQVNEEPEL